MPVMGNRRSMTDLLVAVDSLVQVPLLLFFDPVSVNS